MKSFPFQAEPAAQTAEPVQPVTEQLTLELEDLKSAGLSGRGALCFLLVFAGWDVFGCLLLRSGVLCAAAPLDRVAVEGLLSPREAEGTHHLPYGES